MTENIRIFTSEDYDAARHLWETTPGVGVSDADSRAGIDMFLQRNPGFSFVALVEGRLVGTILVGHDGRRGHIHHLAVEVNSQGRGLARKLVNAGLEKLVEAGIQKCHLLVFHDNESGQAFWRLVGAEERPALALYSIALE
jgi:ribosomal protein S18 acetylase RimI-like enzyme